MKQFFSSKNGIVLPLIVILTLIMLILGMTILSIGRFERIGTGRRTQQVQALYLAEAGAYRAYALLSGGTTPSWYNIPQTLGSGTYLVQEDEDGNILSTGTRGNIHQTVKLELQRSGGGRGIFADGIFGSTSVTITGSSEIRGYNSIDNSVQNAEASSNSLISIPTSGKIFGNAGVATGGSITYPQWSPNAITGQKTYNNEPRTLSPASIPSALQNMAYTPYGDSKIDATLGNYQIINNNFSMNIWPRIISFNPGDYKFNNFSLTSDDMLSLKGTIRIYLTGNFSMLNNSRLIFTPGTTLEIYLGQNSNFTLSNSAKINQNGSPANCAIYSVSTKTINMNGTGNAEINGVVYAPMAEVTVANSTTLRGGVVANTVAVTGNARIHYDTALSSLSVPGDPGSGGGGGVITILRWTKPSWESRL